ncbi:MAG: AMP-binding protein, partial [Sphingomonadales bacterium]|nr:AMP-binding protein [Sphingomonadales bacterium]
MTIQSIGELVDSVAARHPEQTALKIGGHSTSYGELSSRSNRFGHAMCAMGVGHGDRVVFIGRNSEAYFNSFFGTAKMGGVYVNVNWRLAPAELSALIHDAAPKILVVESEFRPLLKTALADGGLDAAIIVVGAGEAGDIDFDTMLAEADEGAVDVDLSADDVVMQMYTSGTTGLPKGVQLTHAGLLFMRDSHKKLGDWAQWDESERLLLCTPGFHVSAVAWIVLGLATGATIVVIKDFVPAEVLRLMDVEKVTQMMAVPAMMGMLLMSPHLKDTDLSSLKQWYYGASPISPDLLQKCMDTFDCDFVQLYGMTECSGLCA